MVEIADLPGLVWVPASIRQQQRSLAQPLRGIHKVLASGHNGAKSSMHQEIKHVVAISSGGNATVVLVKTLRAGFLCVWVDGLGQIAAALGGIRRIQVLKLNGGAKLRAEVVAHAQQQSARIGVAVVKKTIL